MDHVAWSMVQDLINRKEHMTKQSAKKLKAEYNQAVLRRQEMLDKAVEYFETAWRRNSKVSNMSFV
jgi:hypothetical protein